MKKLLLLAAAVMWTVAPAQAASVLLGLDPTPWNTDNVAVLTLSDTVPPGNQTKNIPCIICANNQPQQPALFGYNQYGSNGDNFPTVAFFSTAVVPPGPGSGLLVDQFAGATGYSIGAGSPFLAALFGDLNFSIGLDVNQANGAPNQVLESFWFLNLTTHTVLAAFSPGPGGVEVPPTNNGTGFPDYTINGLTLNGISAGDQIMFFSRITGATDGPDSFFLIASQAPDAVPIPAVGAGIPGIIAAAGAILAWRRRRKLAKADGLIAA